MNKSKLVKVIASSLAVVSMLTVYPIRANAEWKQDSNGWWNKEGSSWSVGWKEIDGKWYYFRQDGYMAHDTAIDGYELGSDGAWIQAASNNLLNSKNVTDNKDKNFDINEFKNTLKTGGYPIEVRDTLYKENSASKGWKLVNGKYYYFSFEGALARDEIVDGYYLGVDGALDTTKGKSQLQDITMKTEKNVYPLNTEKIRIDITNNTNLESGYGGAYYQIDKFENNEWHNLEFAEDTSFNDLAAILPAKGTGMAICRLSILKDFNKLTAGKYRILAEIENSIGYSHVTAEFELQ
ncbi:MULTISPECIES: immunoglobulin-like domain-containing protein [unclassified Clostridium]|uniref:immunoglobulin-like domain-containing protein n=1 Tax=unclassified Clostridium TaxID=2614128 RepID=UPI0002976D77|nr:MULTISPECIES: immunoglobulin-like domain-containing protein [unclassified Clostridium]EKQ52775.1 MAG: putative cell wall binding protein [Clostridium sp. Maddingley MBC34-26]